MAPYDEGAVNEVDWGREVLKKNIENFSPTVFLRCKNLPPSSEGGKRIVRVLTLYGEG